MIKKDIHKAFCPASVLACMLVIALQINPASLSAQVNPPRPIVFSVSPVQNINFGSFAIIGSGGGTVTISNTGIRTCTGDIFLVGNDYNEGIFALEVFTGTDLYMMNGLSVTLTGSNSGSMEMTLGATDPEMPIKTTSPTTVFHIGGTLVVQPVGNNPPGEYNGTYEIIINHQ
jgi:hypothetical protein